MHCKCQDLMIFGHKTHRISFFSSANTTNTTNVNMSCAQVEYTLKQVI